MTLKARLSLGILVAAEGALLAALALTQALERRHLERRQAQGLTESLQRFARVCKDASLQGNEPFLVNYMRSLRDLPELRYAAFLDAEGRVRVHSALLDGRDVAGRPWDGPRNRAERVQVASSRADGAEVSDWSSAILRAGELRGEAHLGFDAGVLRDMVERDLRESRGRLALAAAAVTAVVVLLAWWFSRRIGRAVGGLLLGSQRLSAGDLAYRIPDAGDDELGLLARAFNAMASELQKADALKQKLGAGLAHDLRSALQAIAGHARTLLEDRQCAPEERSEAIQVIHDNAQRLFRLTDDFTDLVKLRRRRLDLERGEIRLGEIAAEVFRLLEPTARKLMIRLESDVPQALPGLRADPRHVTRILINLVTNALKFTPSGGLVAIRAKAEPHHVRIAVEDTGQGMLPEKLETLFTAFAPPAGDGGAAGQAGTGLGLSICRELVAAHGGRISAFSAPGQGTRIVLTLPLGDTECSENC